MRLGVLCCGGWDGMVVVLYGDMTQASYSTRGYFKNEYEEECITEPLR